MNITTAAALAKEPPPWLKLGLTYRGLKELLDDGTLNPKVLEFFRATRYPLQNVNRKTKWCAAFACAMLEGSGIPSPRSSAAEAFEGYGEECEPRFGAIVCMPHHVTFWFGDHDGWFYGFGGNQQNMVCASLYPKSRITAIRWPVIGAPPLRACAVG